MMLKPINCRLQITVVIILVACLGVILPGKVSAQAFDDVPTDYWAFSFIESLSANGITSGCGGGNYCPEDVVSRAQMAVFLERGINGSTFSPPAASGNVFLDVGAGDFATSFIEQLASDRITAGCGNNNYCPNADITRAQMAVFLLRAKRSSSYSPPPATGVFSDVPVGSFAADWIEQLAAEGITSGCGNNNFCPNAPVTRAQMAVFLVRTFGLFPADLFRNPTLVFEEGTEGPSDSGLFSINDDRVSEWGIVDLTGDGLDDVIATFPGYDSQGGVRHARPIRIFAQTGNATLSDITSSLIVGQVPATEFTRRILLADFNGDGLTDVFFCNIGLELPTNDPGTDWHEPDILLLSNTNGNYEDRSINIPGLNDYYSHGGAVGDIDGDGDVDILVNVNNWPPVGIVVYVNDGTGNFTLGVDLIPMWDYGGPVAPVTGDLWIELLDADGDGDLDLFSAGNVPAKHYVAINDGTGRFNVQQPVSLPDPIWPLVEGALVSDLDGDGLDDLVLVNTNTSADPWDHQLQILMSNGDGSFDDETKTRLPAPAGTTTNPHIFKADLNGDGVTEILNVIGQSVTSVVDFYANNGTGAFTRINTGFIDELPHSYSPIDLDNDGDIDFVASGWVESLGVAGLVVYEALTRPDF